MGSSGYTYTYLLFPLSELIVMKISMLSSIFYNEVLKFGLCLISVTCILELADKDKLVEKVVFATQIPPPAKVQWGFLFIIKQKYLVLFSVGNVLIQTKLHFNGFNLAT